MSDELRAEFAGEERTFRLRLGEIFDLEDAVGIGFGEIYARTATHRFYAKDLVSTIKLGLIGGGMDPDEAGKLVRERLDVYPISRLATLALRILLAAMEGIPPSDKATGDGKKPFDQGRTLESFAKAGISPEELRGIRFKDFVLLLRAASGNTIEAPTEDEFEDMLRRRFPDLVE